MRLFEVATKGQNKVALEDNQIIFLSGGQKLSGTFDKERDYFLCKYENRYFVSQINCDDHFGIYVDNVAGKIAIKMHQVDKMYLIKEDSDTWPEPPPTVSSK